MEYSGILHLVQSLQMGSATAQVPVMATATAYFDESNTDATYVVAGFAATVERWRAFDSDWAGLLDKYRVSHFHAKDYAHSNGQFASWKGDEVKRKQFMERAIRIIARRCMVSVGIVVDRRAFQATIAQDEVASSFYVNEYSTAAFMSLLVTGRWADDCPLLKDPVNYVFDRGNPHRSDFQRAYDLALKIPFERERLGALSFADDQRVPALQAADLIAYESCKLYTDLQRGKKRFRASLKALLSKMRCDIKVTSERNLSALVSKMREIPE